MGLQAQRDGVSRRSMEEMAMPPGIQLKIGFDVWENFRAWARDKHEFPLFRLLAYLLPSQEELRQIEEVPNVSPAQCTLFY